MWRDDDHDIPDAPPNSTVVAGLYERSRQGGFGNRAEHEDRRVEAEAASDRSIDGQRNGALPDSDRLAEADPSARESQLNLLDGEQMRPRGRRRLRGNTDAGHQHHHARTPGD